MLDKQPDLAYAVTDRQTDRQTDRNNSIAFLNLLMTIAIILYHSKNHYQLYVVERQLSTRIISLFYGFDDMLGEIALSFFFTVSGFLLYYGINSLENCVAKIKRRLFSLAVPFVLWNAIWFIYGIIQRCVIDRKTFDWTFFDILFGFSITPFDGPLWYIFALLLLLPFSLVFYRCKANRIVSAISLSLITISSFIYYLCIPVNWNNTLSSWLFRFVFYLPCYAFGAFVALSNNSKIFGSNNTSVRIITGVLSAVGLIYLWLYANEYPKVSWWVSKAVPVFLLMSMKNKQNSVVNGCPIAKYTFFYYAMHQPLIGILNTAIYHIFGRNSLSIPLAILSRMIYVCIILSICIGFAQLSKRILPPKLFNALSGGRI